MFTKINECDKRALTEKLNTTYYNFTNGINFIDYFPLEGNIGIVEKGEIWIVRNDEKGNQLIIDTVQIGEMISSLFYPKDELMELRAIGDVRIAMMEYKKIAEYNEDDKVYQQFLKNYNRVLNEKILALNQRVNYLVIKTIRAKLLFYFEGLAAKQRTRTITLPFSFTHLAEYLAIDRSAMNRELKNLKDEKVIASKGRRISLLLKDYI